MTIVLQRVLAALAFLYLATMAVHAWAAGSEITLAPGDSCLSSSCHTEIGKKKYVHPPAAKGDLCVLCHKMPDPGRHEFELQAEGESLCASCHDDHANEKTKHGPVAAGQCLECHDQHASDYRKLTKAAPPDLCFECHDKAMKDSEGKYLPSTKALFDNQAATLHRPFEQGRCSKCHMSHSSPNHRLLKRSYPESFYASYSKEKYFCLKCHKKKAFQEPRTLTATAFRNGNLNLHFRHVNKKKGRTCRACHHHHGATDPKLIRKSVPFGDRRIVIEDFELTETGGTCGPTCHSLVSYDRVEPVNNAMKVSPRQGEDATSAELSGSQP